MQALLSQVMLSVPLDVHASSVQLTVNAQLGATRDKQIPIASKIAFIRASSSWGITV